MKARVRREPDILMISEDSNLGKPSLLTNVTESTADCFLGGSAQHFEGSSPRLRVGVYPFRASNPHPTCRTSPL